MSVCSVYQLTDTNIQDTDVDDPDEGAVRPKGSAAWKPQLHFVWNLIFDIYFPPTGNPSSKIKNKASFPEFFRTTVDGI